MEERRTFEFLIQGSEPMPYVVVFERIREKVRVTCTCRAGTMGQVCRHRLSLFTGDVTALVGDNHAEVMPAVALVTGTALESALQQLAETEAQAEKWKQEVTRQRRAVARLMQGGQP